MQSYTLWPSHEGSTSPSWLKLLGVLSLLIYVTSQFLWPDLAEKAQTLLAAIGLIAFCIYGKNLRRTPLLLLTLFICVQLLSWSLGLWQYPQWAIDNPRIKDLAKLFIFICIAWWLGGSTKNTLIIWGLAALFFLIATFIAPTGDGWLTGLSGQRVGFGIRNQQHASMLFGVTLLGLLCFSKRFWTAKSKHILWRIIWCLSITIVLIGIAVGQTRAVWISLTLAILIGFIILSFIILKRGVVKRFAFYSAVTATITTLILGALYMTFEETLNDRLNTENNVVSQLLNGDISQVPYTSIGIRINSWIAASEWISERPLTGWGPKGRDLVMSETSWLPDWVLMQYGHLHNYFLETWVEYGLIGLVAMCLLTIWIGRATWLAWQRDELPNDMAIFGIIFFFYWITINQFESYNSFPSGQFVHNLVVGGLITYYWKSKKSLTKNQC